MGKEEELDEMLFDLEIGFLHRMLWIILFVHMYSKASSFINIKINIIAIAIILINPIFHLKNYHNVLIFNRRQSVMCGL